MTESVIVALGTSHPETVRMLKEVIFELQARARSHIRIEIAQGQAARETVKGIPALVREACTRAQVLRHEKQAPVGIASADGDIELVYNHCSRKAKFTVRLIVGVTKSGLFVARVRSSCPDEAKIEFIARLQGQLKPFTTTNVHEPAESYSAQVVTCAWAELAHTFPEAEISLLG